MSDNVGSYLMVPMHIDALIVGKDPSKTKGMFQWTNLTADFHRLQGSAFFGAELFANKNPFKATKALLPKGVHLHFRLPRALTNGKQSGTGKLTFPPIPNRWLVQRVSENNKSESIQKKLFYKAWLIESDGMSEQSAPGITWPTFHRDKPAEFRKMGRCTELTGPLSQEDAPAKVHITAVGPGEPTFAAYYPACQGVLGFHDSLEGIVKDTRLSYLVTCWYSDPKDDPLGNYFSEFCERELIKQDALDKDEVDEELNKFKWLKKPGPGWEVNLDGENKPPVGFSSAGRFLGHGLVRGIDWKGENSDYFEPAESESKMNLPAGFPFKDKHQTSYKLGLGNTISEAIAGLLAPGEVEQDLLTALQYDLLSQPLTAETLQSELHERRFNDIKGGTVFLIRQQPDPPNVNKSAKAPKSGGAIAIPVSLQKMLRELNLKQHIYDEHRRSLDDLRWQVYALWYLLTKEKLDDKVEYENETHLEKARELLKTERKQWLSIVAERDACQKTIEDALDKYAKNRPAGSGAPEYRLATSPAPSFYMPSDPAVAIQGEAMTSINTWSPVGNLQCRISGQELKEFNLVVQGEIPQTITGESLILALFEEPDKLSSAGGIHRSLLAEALLLDENNAKTIAAMASSNQADSIANNVKKLQNSKVDKPSDSFNKLIGVPPDQSFPQKWRGNPWIPIFLVWEVSWSPAHSSLDTRNGGPAQDFVTKRWDLNHQVGRDLFYKNAENTAPDPEQKTELYKGHSILTSSIAVDLAKRLEKLNSGRHPLSVLLKNQRIQAQVLDGFNDALLLQQPGIQLPPWDYKKWFNDEDLILDAIQNEINTDIDGNPTRFRTAPHLGNAPFLPIRAGQFKVEKLSIVDAFGQTLILPMKTVESTDGSKDILGINDSVLEKSWQDRLLRQAHTCAANKSLVTEEKKKETCLAELSPRFVRPARLKFEWEDAWSKSSENTGPVCGWILPNHLEKNLTIFSASGKPLGALQRKLSLGPGSKEQAFYWVDVPGGQNADIENLDLLYFKEWVLGLKPDDGSAFSACIDAVIAATDERMPEEDPGVTVLVGRPLALVRASIRFENASRRDLRIVRGSRGRSLDLAQELEVRWPLRLGDLHTRSDGLIGAFKCYLGEHGDDLVSRGPFYPTWGQDISKGAVFAPQDFEINSLVPLQLTLLMDPQARVHATTGTLPRAYIELPPEDVTGAKRSREVFFQTAPVLGLSAMPEMPRPSDDYGEWSWAYQPQVSEWKVDPAMVEATDRAAFCDTWPSIAEGWLKLAIAPVKVLSFWMLEQNLPKGGEVHLVWSLKGAERLKLEQVGKAGSQFILVEQWGEPPFPREYVVKVVSETTYRLTAFSQEVESWKEITINPAIEGNEE